MMLRPLLLVGLILLPSAVLAQSPLPRLAGRVEISGCRQGQCIWVRYLDVRRSRVTPLGELRQVRLRQAGAPYGAPRSRLRWAAEPRTDYIFCSRTRPAVAFRSEDAFIIHFLDLYDLAGYQQSSARMYMRVCHNREPANDRMLRRLGYRPGTRNEQVEGGRPADLLI